MSVFIGHSSGSKPATAAAAAADILEAELALGGTPGPTRYYGTNASAVRGFYPLPTGPGGGSTNLGIGFDAVSVSLTSSSGSGTVIPAATTTLAGAMTAADRIKLNGIATGATLNAPDAQLRDRATHTGTQSIATVAGLALALAAKADLSSAAFGNLSSTDYFAILDTASSFTMTLEFAAGLTNDQTILLPNASGTLALVGHAHTADDLTDATVLGKAVMRLTAPPATRFAAFNAGGTVTLLDEPNFRSAIGACAGDDARLSDARTPTAHTHPASAISDSSTVGRALMTAANPSAVRYVRINADNSITLLDAAAFLSAIAACANNDARLSDARTPTAHTHPASAISDSSTVGRALMTAANPSAVRYVRINADNSITLLDAAAFLSAIGGGAASPAGTGTELQFRNGTGFGGVANSFVSGGTITLGGAENYGASPGALFAVRNTTAATSSVQQVSPAVSMEGQGWNSTAGASQSVEFQMFMRPSSAAGPPTGVWVLRSRSNAGAWTDQASFGNQLATLPWTTGTAFDVTGARLWASACRLSSSGLVQWSDSGSVDTTADLFLRRRSAASLQIGPADGAAPVAQNVSVQNVVAGTTNTAGVVWSLDGSRGTGTGVGGAVRIRTAPAGSSGTAQNAFVDSVLVRPGRGVAISNGNFAAASDCIGEITVLRGATSGTTPVILSESALGGGLPIPLNTVTQAIVLVQGMSEAGDVARYARQICVKNFAGTSTLDGSATTVGADQSATTALSLTVSDTTDTLDISVTGTAGANWRWSAVIFGGELVRNVPV